MATNTITLPKDAPHWQQQLFTLEEPVSLSKGLFELVRLLIGSVYTFATGCSKEGQLKLGIEQLLKESRKSISTMMNPDNDTHHDSGEETSYA